MRIGPPPPPCLSRYLFARSRRIWRLTARADRAAARSGPGNRHSRSHVRVAWRLAIRLVRDIVASSESGWTRHYARGRTRRKQAVALRRSQRLGVDPRLGVEPGEVGRLVVRVEAAGVRQDPHRPAAD